MIARLKLGKNSIILFFLFTIVLVHNGFSQATFSSASYQATLSQQEVDVTFSQAVATPSTAGWTVTVAGSVVPLISATMFGTTVVRVKIDASTATGHVAGEVYIKPGDVVTIAYNSAAGTLTSTGGVTSFGAQTATNNWVFSCASDIAFYQETDYVSVNQCAPVTMNFHQWEYRYSLRYRNSSTWNAARVDDQVVWGDGTTVNYTTYQSDASGNANATYIDPTGGFGGNPSVIMTIRPSHAYPSAVAGAAPNECHFSATITPFVNGVAGGTCTSASKTTIFASYSTDNKLSGALAVPPPAVAGTNNVCLGSNVNMMFNDNTTLNCALAAEGTVPNQFNRWVRIVYGSQNGASGNIPNVTVTLPASFGGAVIPVTDASGTLLYPSGYYPTTGSGPTNNIPDVNGVIQIPFPVTAPTGTAFMGTIKTTSATGQAVNQTFWVQLQYWDVCNQYSGDPTNPAPVTSSAAVTIIANNNAPTISPLIFCANQASANYSMTATTGGPSAGGTFKWYSDATLTTLRQTGASYNPVSSAPNLNKNPATATTTDFYITETIGDGCVSPATTAPFTVVPSVVAGSVVYSGTSPLCTGSDPPSIFGDGVGGVGVHGALATKGDGVTYTYQWQNSPDNVTFTNIVGATSTNYDPPVLTSTTYFRRVDSSGPCASIATNVIKIQIDQLVVGGSVGTNQTICTGSTPAAFTNTGSPTGGNGTFSYQWQSSLDNVTFTNIPSATSATYSSGILAQTTYFLRNVTSGVCPGSQGTQPSNVITLTVNQVVNGGTVNGNQTICSGLTPAPFTSVSAASGGDGSSYTYLWQQSTVSSSGPWSSASGANTGLAYAPPALTQTTFYQRLATSGVCSSQPSGLLTVTVNPLPVATNPTGGGAVCSGNPAPDIVWNLTTGTAPFTGTWTGTAGTYAGTFNFSQAGVVLTTAPNTVTLTSPITVNSGTYKLLTLIDANGCQAPAASISALTPATITIGGSPPTFNPAGNEALTPTSACNAGVATTDPQLNFTLDALSASLTNFVLTYKIDGSANRTKTFNTNAASQPTTAITFADAELNTVGAHTITLVSIQSSAGCLSVFNATLNFTVNPLPVLVTPQTETICSGAAVNYEILLTPANTPAGTKFTWPVPTVSAGPAQGTSGTNVAADPAGTKHLTDVLTNTTGAAITVTYAITPTSNLGCPGTPQNVVVTVNPAPVITAGQTKTICSGSAINLEVLEAPANSPAGTLFNWAVPTVSAGPAQGTAGVNVAADPAGKKHLTDVLTNTTGASITVTYKITPTSNPAGCVGTQVPVVITVNPAPVITAGQTKTICSGSAVNLEVLETPANSPAGTKFNWAAPTVSAGPAQGTAGTNVLADPAGTIHISDVLTNVTGANITVTYKITPTSASGCVGTQVPVVITVEPAPNIVAGQTKSICSGQNASYEILLSPVNTPAGTLFNWPDPDGGGPATAGVNVPMGVAGTKHITDILTNGTTAPITVTYQVTPTSGAGCVGTTQGVAITVNPLPVANPISGPSTVCSGSSIQFYQSTFDAGSTYAWTVPALFTKFAGGTTTDFYVLLQFPTVGSATLQMTETNSYGCSGSLNTLPITVSSAPGAIAVTGPQQVCSGDTKTYQVISNPSSNFSWVVTSGNASITPPASGPNLFSISVIFGSVATPVTLQVTETSSSGCVGAPVNYPITMNNVPAMNSSSSSTTCSGVAPSLTFTSTNGTSNYSWNVVSITGSLTGVTSGQSGTGSLSSTFTGAAAIKNVSGAVGSVTFNVTPTSTTTPFCAGATQSVVLTVNPEPVLVTPQTKTICSGQAVNYEILLSPLNLPAGTVFNWPMPVMSDASSQGSPGVNVADGSAGTLHIVDVLVNNTSSPITATYTITPGNGISGCSGTPRTVVITVNPQPVLSPSLNSTICSGAATGLTLTTAVGSVAANNYNITSVTVPAGLTKGANAIVPASAVGSTYLSNDSYLNITNGALTVAYTVVPISAAGCSGSPVIINITINPQPSLSSTLDMTLCSRIATGLTLSTTGVSTPATGYNITGITITPGLVAGGSNAIIPALNKATNYLAADVFTNTGNTALTVVYQVVPVSAMLCPGDPPKSITITVNPEPVIGNTSSSVCSGTSIGLTLNTNGTSIAAASYNITNRTIAPGLIAGGSNATVPQSGVPSGYLTADVFTNTTGAALAVSYTIVPVSATPCSGQAKVITITINPEPVMSSSLDETVCSDNATGLTLNTNGTSVAAASFNITSRAISGGLTPNIANAAVPATGVAAGYLSNDIFTNTGANPLTVTYTVVPVSSSGSCLGASKIVTITIDPEPVVSGSLDATVCSIVPIGLNLNTNGSSVAAATYNITAIVVAAGLVPGSNAIVPASNEGAAYLATDTYSNTGTTPLTVKYTVVPISAAGCLGDPKVITLTVSPEPVVSNLLNATVCSETASGLTLNTNGTSVAAANYNVTLISVATGLTPAATNAAIPASNVVPNYLINDKFTNTGNTSLPVVYTVVPLSAAGCPGPSKQITITINPEPVVSTGLNVTVCSGVSTSLTLNTNGSSVAAANYNIISKTIAGGLVPGGGNATVPLNGVAANYLANDVFTNTTTLPLNITYTVVGISSSGCVGQPQVITISINPEPVLATTLNNTLCSSTATNLTLNTNGTSVAAASYNVTNISLAPGLSAAGTNAVIPFTGVSNTYLSSDKFVNTTTNPLAATYTIVPVSAANCAGAPVNVVITINPEPVISTLLNETVCSDVATGLVLNTNGTSVAALNYNITARSIDPGLTPAGANAGFPATAVAANYLANDKFTNITNNPLVVTYTVVAMSGATCVGQPRTITITINPKPVLSGSLNLTQCSEVTTGLVLNTNGTSVAAQNYNITAISMAGGLTAAGSNASVPAAGVNASYLANDSFTNTGAGNLNVVYTVVPVSASGCAGVPMPVTVTIQPQPVVALTLSNTVCSRLITGLTLTTNGTSVAAVNYNIISETISGGLVASGTNATVPATGVVPGYLGNDVFTNTTNSALTVAYTIVPVSAAGCLGDPQIITMTINPEPVVAPGLDNSVCSGTSIGLTLNTNGASVGAANYSITASVVSAGLTPAGTNASVPAPNVSASYLSSNKFSNTGNVPLSVTYTVVPFSSSGCQGQPKVITITINPEPVVASGLDESICSSVATGLTLNTNGTSVSAASYNIVSVTIGGTLTASGTNAVVPNTGVTNSYLSLDVFKNIANFSQTVSYVVVPVSGLNCVGATKTITITVNPEPVGSNLTDPQCATTLNHSIQSQITNGVNSVFTYTVSSDNAGVPAAGNRTVASAAPIADVYTNNSGVPANLTYTIIPFSSANNCQGASFTYVVTISPTPVGANSTQAALCSRSVISINPQSKITNGVTATFSWTAVYDNNLTGGTGAGSGTITDNLTNLTANPLNATYTVTPTSGPCPGVPFTIIQPVNPEPVMDPSLAVKTICSNNPTSSNPINVTLNTNGASVAAATYNVSLLSQDAGLTGTPTTGAALGSGAIKNDVFNNTGPVPLKVVYQIIPKSTAGCTGQPFTITVTVNPEPVVAVLTNTVCSKDVSNITLATNGASVGAASYKFIAVTVPGTITADGGNKANLGLPQTGGVALIANDIYTNKTSGPVVVTYSILGISGSGCLGQPQNILLTINPEPILVPGAVTVCSGVAPGAAINLGTAVGSAAITQYNLKQIFVPDSLTAAGTNAGLGNYTVNTFLGNDKFTNVTKSSWQVTYTIAPVASGCVGDDYPVVLTVNPAPALDNLNTTVCSNTASGITLRSASSSVLATSFNITGVTIASGLTQTAGNTGARSGVASAEIKNDKFTNTTNGTLTVTYAVVPVSGTCSGPSKNVVLTVEPTILANPVGPSDICSNSSLDKSATNFTLSSPSVPTAGPITFSYTASATNGGLTSGFSRSAINVPNPTTIQDSLVNLSSSPSQVTYVVTPVANGARGGAGCSGSPISIVVTVEPKPKLTASPGIQTICEGVASAIALSSTTTPTSGTIQFKVISVVADQGLTMTSAPVAVYNNGQSITDVWRNDSTEMKSITYTLQPVISGGLGCLGDLVTITLNINPSPNVTSTIIDPTLAPPAICSNDLVNISLSADVSSTINTWTAAVTSGTARGYANGSGDLIFETLQNTSSGPANVRYTVTPKASGCVGPPIVINIEVDPIPNVVFTAPSYVCYGATLNVPLTSAVAGTNFNWTVDPNNSLVPTAMASGTVINQVIMDTVTDVEDFLLYTITAVGPGATACTSTAKFMNIIASPFMSAALTADSLWVCLSNNNNRTSLSLNTHGEQPFTLQYTDGTSNFTVPNFPGFISIQPTVSTTYSLISMKDALGCTIPLNSKTVVTVDDGNATFSILSPLAACTPDATVFQYNQKAGNSYTWQWGDGTSDSTYTAASTVSGQLVKHRYINTSLTNSIKPVVFLHDTLSSKFPPICGKQTQNNNLVVYAQLKTSVSADKSVICSGDVVQFTNQTVGQASGNSWFYRYQGNTTQQLNPMTTINASYTLSIDSTKTNPQIIEVVYNATNGHCPADTVIQITVYKSITANFTDIVPYFIGGSATVTFNNTSKAFMDWPQFRFDWDFGSGSSPATLTSSSTPILVNYSSPGPRDVTLLATNVAAEAAGLTCTSTITQTITILLKPLIAEFKINPNKGCYPSNITVTENLSTGDRFKWSVVDELSRDTVSSSNVPFPVFSISSDGSYIVSLITSSSYTGQTASDTAHLILYPKPEAIFDAFPTTVYIPDQAVTTINGSGGTANQYLWDFGDGSTSSDFQPTHTYKFEGVDSLKFTAQYDHGGGIICSQTNFKIIVAKQGGVAKIPNAFTPSTAGPNGGVGGVDLYNYVFLPQVKGVEEFNMQIYDRWGNLIFESTNQTIGWDGYDQNGRLLPSGVYVYKLTLRLSDQQRTTQVGDVTLIR